jgi:hypothetical protein
MKEKPFKYHNELKGAFRDIPEQEPDASFSESVMAELTLTEQDTSGLAELAEIFLAPAFLTMGVSLASVVYLVLLTSNTLDSLQVFSVIGLFSGDFGL